MLFLEALFYYLKLFEPDFVEIIVLYIFVISFNDIIVKNIKSRSNSS